MCAYGEKWKEREDQKSIAPSDLVVEGSYFLVVRKTVSAISV